MFSVTKGFHMWQPKKYAGARCPYHEIPQPRKEMWKKEGTSAVSVDYVFDEIFGLHSVCRQYVNCKKGIVKNCQEDVPLKVRPSCDEKGSSELAISVGQDKRQRYVLALFTS